MMLYGDKDLCQHWLRQWRVAWWHQAITSANIDLLSVRSNEIHLRAISLVIPQPSVTKYGLKTTYVSFHSNLPGANELNGNCKPFLALKQAAFCQALTYTFQNSFSYNDVL